MRKTRKPLAAAIALALVTALGVGATLAWLTDQTSPVTNTFTVGNIDIDLWEHDYIPETGELDMGKQVEANADYKMVPGTVLPKDPTVTVEAGSEDCWLFVKVVQASSPGKYLSWSVDDCWAEVEGSETANFATGEVTKYYYLKDPASAKAGETYAVLAGNQVAVKDSVTKEMMDSLAEGGEGKLPTLTFEAAAVQKANIDDVKAAWEALPGEFTNQ